MSTLIVGAGAVGGYLGSLLISAGHDVTFLVRPARLERLTTDGLRIRRSNGVDAVPAHAVTTSGLRGPYDVVVLAVRSNMVASAIDDLTGTITPDTRIVPVVNGIRHLSLLTDAFGQDVVLGATARLATSMLPDGTIEEVVPGIQFEIGQLDGGRSHALSRTVDELDVDSIAVTIRNDAVAAMWEKFAFITSTAALTCLVGQNIGTVAQTAGGRDLAQAVLTEVAAVAAAEHHPLGQSTRSTLAALLTDPASAFAPSMFRDMKAGRPVEVTVLTELADLARSHDIATPLLDAAIVVVDAHNRGGIDLTPGTNTEPAADDEDVRLAIYRGFATTGAAPDADGLATSLGIDTSEAREHLRRLACARHLVLDQEDRIVMAHPFAAIPLGFSVMGTSTMWWGGCAWDSFAIPHLVDNEPDVLVATRCPACDTPHAWVVNGHQPPDGLQVAHFLVPVTHMWDDVVHTCAHQRIFCSEACIDRWLASTSNERGYVMDLATLWRLARGWYRGRLDRGYERREPAEAAAYFRDVGLDGSFWGL
jgi:2-dehydropantoate 2-reductase